MKDEEKQPAYFILHPSAFILAKWATRNRLDPRRPTGEAPALPVTARPDRLLRAYLLSIQHTYSAPAA